MVTDALMSLTSDIGSESNALEELDEGLMMLEGEIEDKELATPLMRPF